MTDWQYRTRLAAQLIALVGIVVASLIYGLKIRRGAWDVSSEIHFRVSLNNAIRWGQYTNQWGRLTVYQKLVDKYGDEGEFKDIPGSLGLDYPPLRLLIISKWEAWTEQQFPLKKHQQARWRSDYEFNRPMLWLNNACEIAGAVAMFLLVHYWLRQCAGPSPTPVLRYAQEPGLPDQQSGSWAYLRTDVFNSPNFFLGVWPALFAALLLWFNPAVIFNAHCYPQWDVWILAPFLIAVYLGLRNQWLIAGICIGVVAMGKGQILLVTPVLAVWQLCIGKAGAILRLGIGILLANGLIASSWLVSTPSATHWMITTLIALGLMSSLFFYRNKSRDSLILHGSTIVICLGLVLWPWIFQSRPAYFGWAFLALIIAITVARFLPRQWASSWFAAGLTSALFACVPLFNTSMAWYTVGIAHSTRQWPLLYWCRAMNLGAILEENFHWEWADTIATPGIFQPFIHDPTMPMRYLMIAAYILSLILCGIALAIHHRRKSPMFFFAMVAPWVLMFALLPQMQNRYLVWAAAFSAAPAAISLDAFMLYLLLAAISVIDTAVDMLGNVPESATAQKWQPLLDPMFPDLAWGVMLIAAIWLYLAFFPALRWPRFSTFRHLAPPHRTAESAS